jgi:hypothetical protein
VILSKLTRPMLKRQFDEINAASKRVVAYAKGYRSGLIDGRAEGAEIQRVIAKRKEK